MSAAVTAEELLSAWAALQDPATADSTRAAAWGVIYVELGHLAAKQGIRKGVRDDCVSTANLKIHKALQSPRGRSFMPDAAAGVRAYLRKALKSVVANMFADRAWSDEAAVDNAASPAQGPDAAAAGLEVLVSRCVGQVIEPLGRRLRDGRGAEIERALREMLSLRLGARSVAEILAQPATTPGFSRARAAMYTRHKRARDAVLEELDRRERLGTLPVEEVRSYRGLIDALRRRRPASARGQR